MCHLFNFSVIFSVKPTAPSLSIPNAIVEGLPLNFNFTCEADVGYPHGKLYVKTKLQNETDFKALWVQDEMTEEETNCSNVSFSEMSHITRKRVFGNVGPGKIKNQPAQLQKLVTILTLGYSKYTYHTI